MAPLLKLFRSCFKWLIQIKPGILFLGKAAAALSELGCFYQCCPPPTPNRMAREDQGNFTHAVPADQAQQPWENGIPSAAARPLLVTPLSLRCDYNVGSPDFHSVSYLILSKA